MPENEKLTCQGWQSGKKEPRSLMTLLSSWYNVSNHPPPDSLLYEKDKSPHLLIPLLLSIQLLTSEHNLTDAPSYFNIFFMETKTELNYRHLIIYTCAYLFEEYWVFGRNPEKNYLHLKALVILIVENRGATSSHKAWYKFWGICITEDFSITKYHTGSWEI